MSTQLPLYDARLWLCRNCGYLDVYCICETTLPEITPVPTDAAPKPKQRTAAEWRRSGAGIGWRRRSRRRGRFCGRSARAGRIRVAGAGEWMEAGL